MSNAVSDWHMWGGSEDFETRTIAFHVQRATQKQIARIDYKRPETWCFFLHGRIRGPIDPVNAALFFLRFDVLLGIGRSMIDTAQTNSQADSFCTMAWSVPAGTDPNSVAGKWTTKTRTPLLVDTDPTSYESVDRVVGENIQVGANLFVQGVGGAGYGVTASAYFAPLHHARPEWFCKQFKNGEL